jgi:hypothetical protein
MIDVGTVTIRADKSIFWAPSLVRPILAEVVQLGTTNRLAGVFKLPDGTQIPVGGKTGTGDNC